MLCVAEDREPEPIADNVYTCAFADNAVGSYDVSVLFDNVERSSGDRNNGQYQAGLAIVCDYGDYTQASSFSKISRGDLYMVSNLGVRVVYPLFHIEVINAKLRYSCSLDLDMPPAGP